MDQLHQPLPTARSGLLARVIPEWKNLALLGGPILVAQLAQIGNSVIDTVMSGHASAQDLAGVAVASSLWVPLMLFCVGLLGALQPIISGHNGSRQWHRILPITWQGIYIAGAISLVMILLLINVRPLLDLFSLEPVSASIAEHYLKALAWGLPAMCLLVALRGLTDGLGHTRVMMVFFLCATLINLPLNYILIYGKFGLPTMGGVGCGWATTISHWLAAIILLIYLNRSAAFRHFHLLTGWVPPRREELKQVLNLGLPIGFTLFIEVSMFSVIALFLSPLGPTVVAGHQIVLNVVSLLFMVPLSLGMALTLRVSFLIGAEQQDTARLLARSALVLALAIALIYAPGLLLAREWIAHLYTSDEAVRKIAIQLLVYGAIFQIADVLQVTAINALRGYRDTRVPMVIMLVSFWGICLPLGYVLTFTTLWGEPMGAPGFWIALTTGLVLASILLAWRLMRIRPQGHPG